MPTPKVILAGQQTAPSEPPRQMAMGFNPLSQCRHGWMLYHTADQFKGDSRCRWQAAIIAGRAR